MQGLKVLAIIDEETARVNKIVERRIHGRTHGHRRKIGPLCRTMPAGVTKSISSEYTFNA